MTPITIRSVDAVIIDLPLRRLQRFSALGTRSQSFVILSIMSEDGVVGTGEAVTPSGPWWSGESVESIKLHVDTYLAPLLIGRNAFELDAIQSTLARAMHGNQFAKAAIEMALLDLIGKTLKQPVYNLLGGVRRTELPVAWPLATGRAAEEIDEAEEKLALRLHRSFKIKMGALEPAEDVERACQIARALQGRARVWVDPNETWTESTAAWAVPRLADAGVVMVEQPLPRWNLEGMQRLAARVSLEVMLDESVCSLQDLFRVAEHGARGTVSLKVMKSGGLRTARTLATVAEARGLGVYMGTFLESSLGTAGSMQVCATLPDLPFGGELIGPLLMAVDICEQPAVYRDFSLHLSGGVGLGVVVDEDKIRHYRRDGTRRELAAAPVASAV